MTYSDDAGRLPLLPNLSMSRRLMLGGLGASLLLPSRFALAQGTQAVATSNVDLLLNGEWQFRLAPDSAAADALENFHAPGFVANGFVDTPVPSNWAVLGFEEPQYRDFTDRVASEGFYLKQFDIPAGWEGRRVLLHCNGIWSSAEIWVNGKPLGRHDSGFTSFAHDIGGQLVFGAANTLAIRVRQVQQDYKFDTNDDWALGGIYGDVWLETMPGERWLDEVQTRTEFDDQFSDADLHVRVMVADVHPSTVPGNYMSPDQPPYDLQLRLTDRDGQEVAARRITVPAHFATSRETRATFRLVQPRQWNAEQPYLYTLTVDLLDGGKPVHTRTRRVGLRQVSTDGGVFRINGQAVKLRGVNRHEEHPDVGRATNRTHWLEDITLMKAANINYVRCAHYPPAPGFLDLCDELGMYVGDEIPLRGFESNDPASAEGTMLRVYESVTRDVHHPSVVYWSVGNEDPLTSLHLSAVRAVKGLDPTRPVLLPWRADDWLPPEIDILAPHYWHPAEYDALGGRATRPIITTEYTHAYGPQGLGSLKERWEALVRHPSGAGAAIWMWADQGLKTLDGSAAGISQQPGLRLTEEAWDGITDSYRRPTLDYWEAKAVYAPVQPAVDSIGFVAGQAEVLIPIRNAYDFTDLSAVRIGWQIMENDRELAAGSTRIAAQPHSDALFPLPLTAIADIQAGACYYAWLTFTDAAGGEIARRAVELLSGRAAVPALVVPQAVELTRADASQISVGETEYRFDPRTGLLNGASLGRTPILAALQPSLSRKPDDNERYIGGRRLRTSPDLNSAVATARNWNVHQDSDGVWIDTVVDHVVDDRNRYTGTYQYHVAGDGRLTVRYAYVPEVEVPWLLHVGMVASAAISPTRIRWLGLGPYDAYPNKQSAAILGLWSGKPGDADMVGVKRSRWTELRDADGAGFRAANDAFIYNDPAAPGRLHLLSHVLGRPEKSRQPIEPVPQLVTGTDSRFVGEFAISLLD